jgi:uncharacterized protein (DUF924 family)
MAHKSTHAQRTDAPDAQDVLTFWVDQAGPGMWYKSDAGLDADIRDMFGPLWEATRQTGHTGWTPTPKSALATVILFDQFPRNMFRGDARAFASDKIARAKAKHAVDLDWDLRIEGPARQFFYLPLMHSECLVDQERCVRLFKERMQDAGDNFVHAKAHREVIRRFGRFPHRNEDLGRTTRKAETEFLEEGGYGAVVNSFRAAV